MLHPYIPQIKLNNAITCYAAGISPSEVLLLIDESFFGSAKNGALLTRTNIYVLNQDDPPRSLLISDFHQIEYLGKIDIFGTQSIKINGTVEIKFNMTEQDQIYNFVQLLDSLKSMPKNGRVTRPDERSNPHSLPVTLTVAKKLFTGFGFECPACGLSLHRDMIWVGRTTQCDSCSQEIEIPMHLEMQPFQGNEEKLKEPLNSCETIELKHADKLANGISFKCPHCGSPLQRDMFGITICEDCAGAFYIPKRFSNSPVQQLFASDQQNHSPEKIDEPSIQIVYVRLRDDSTLEFECPACGKRNWFPLSLLGTVAPCACCHQKVALRDGPAEKLASDVDEGIEELVCGGATEKQVSISGPPFPKDAPEPKKQVNSNDRVVLEHIEKLASGIEFDCPTCQGTLHRDMIWIGRTTECEYCSQKIYIPRHFGNRSNSNTVEQVSHSQSAKATASDRTNLCREAARVGFGVIGRKAKLKTAMQSCPIGNDRFSDWLLLLSLILWFTPGFWISARICKKERKRSVSYWESTGTRFPNNTLLAINSIVEKVVYIILIIIFIIIISCIALM
jgi:DNA-directed RNA polymerase subunit M/transcription elongation factor TFIIS